MPANKISIVRRGILQEAMDESFEEWRPVSRHHEIGLVRNACIEYGARYRAVLASSDESTQPQHPSDLEKIPAQAFHLSQPPSLLPLRSLRWIRLLGGFAYRELGRRPQPLVYVQVYEREEL